MYCDTFEKKNKLEELSHKPESHTRNVKISSACLLRNYVRVCKTPYPNAEIRHPYSVHSSSCY